jgi:aspartate-semialdehyde dehydrogenase
MFPRVNSDRLRKTPNIAIVGSSSPLGKELRDLIEAPEFPAGRVTLLETEEYAGLLQEFAGEIQITQVLSPQAFADVDIAFFSCAPEIISAYAASGQPFPDLTIDLTGTGRDGILFLGGVSSPADLKPAGYYVNPHPATIALGRLLSRVHADFPVRTAAATVLEPASERGAAGVAELQEQTVGLLNFQGVEHRVFGGQLAFNLLPEIAAAQRIETLVRRQLSAALGDRLPQLSLATLQAPVFHSHGFSLFLQLAGSPTVDAVASCLESSGKSIIVHSDKGLSPSPVTVVGSDALHVARLEADPGRPGAFFLWAIADNLRVAASNALQIAENLMFAPAAPRL